MRQFLLFSEWTAARIYFGTEFSNFLKATLACSILMFEPLELPMLHWQGCHHLKWHVSAHKWALCVWWWNKLKVMIYQLPWFLLHPLFIGCQVSILLVYKNESRSPILWTFNMSENQVPIITQKSWVWWCILRPQRTAHYYVRAGMARSPLRESNHPMLRSWNLKIQSSFLFFHHCAFLHSSMSTLGNFG
mgnify:CR=1 FL=1